MAANREGPHVTLREARAMRAESRATRDEVVRRLDAMMEGLRGTRAEAANDRARAGATDGGLVAVLRRLARTDARLDDLGR